MCDQSSWRGYIPLWLTLQVGPFGPPDSPKIGMPHVEPVAAKIIDLITFECRSRNLRLEMRTNAPPRVTARIRACLFDTTEIETVRFIYHSYSL